MKKERILITGGLGFIGSNMAGYHLSKGREVWAIDNMKTAGIKNLEPHSGNPALRFDRADVRTWPYLRDAVKWADRIFHFAASVGQKFVLNNPVYTFINNVESCNKLLEAMEQTSAHARCLLASSSEVYSYCTENQKGIFSETEILGIPPGNCLQKTYPVSKLANEILALAYAYEKGFHCTIARIFNTIGVNQSPAYGMVVPTFIKQASSNQPLMIFGDGLQSRAFSDVRDTIQALDLLLDHSESKGEIYNVGGDWEYSIIDLAHLIIRKMNSHSEIRYLSYEEAHGIPFIDIRKRQPNLEKLKALTGFTCRWTLEDTIDTILRAREKEVAL